MNFTGSYLIMGEIQQIVACDDACHRCFVNECLNAIIIIIFSRRTHTELQNWATFHVSTVDNPF